MTNQRILQVVTTMIREYNESKSLEEQVFDAAWNAALWALLDELGLSND